MKSLIFGFLFLLTASPFLSAQDLIDAVEAKDYEAVKKNLAKGEKVNKPNKQGYFALWKAVWNYDVEMVDLLLKSGANPKQTFKGKQMEIACLEIAAQEGLLEITQLLVNAGAEVDKRSAHGHSPLRIAARNGRVELVKYFLSKGCEVDTRGDDGATPLEAAASKGHLEIVELLIEKGAIVYQTGDIIGVHGVGVIPEMRRQGFAEEIMDFVLDRAVTLGGSYVTLQASMMGRALYDKLGFKEDFTLKNYMLNQEN